PVEVGAKTFDVSLPQNDLRTVSPPPNISFDGALDNGTLIPPDVSGASGKDFVMQSSNQEFDIFSKSGTLINSLVIDNFFSSTGGFSYFDPHVVYDAGHDRYVICCDGLINVNNSNHSAIFVGVSVTSDPNANWYIYDIDAAGN